jgi:hypothetical protein
MFLVTGILAVAVPVVIILHFVVFRHKTEWLNWTVLIVVSGGLIMLLGFGGLHAGLTGVMTAIIGFFWLTTWHSIMNKKTNNTKECKKKAK